MGKGSRAPPGPCQRFSAKSLCTAKSMPSKTGKRRAHCKSAGAKGGRPKKAAAADVVLQQPAAELPVKGAAVLGRPPKKRDAADDQKRQRPLASKCPSASARARTSSGLLLGAGNPEEERRESRCQGKGKSGGRGKAKSSSRVCIVCFCYCLFLRKQPCVFQRTICEKESSK